jgi:hypothetical protein
VTEVNLFPITIGLEEKKARKLSWPGALSLGKKAPKLSNFFKRRNHCEDIITGR